MLPLNKTLIFFMHKLYLDLLFAIQIDRQILNKVLSKYSYIFGFSRIYEQIYEYIRLSKNLRMNIRIYLYWGNVTNTNTNNILGPFFLSNIWIFEYLCSSQHHNHQHNTYKIIAFHFGIIFASSVNMGWNSTFNPMVREGIKKPIGSVIMIIPHCTPPLFFTTVIALGYFCWVFFYELGNQTYHHFMLHLVIVF